MNGNNLLPGVAILLVFAAVLVMAMQAILRPMAIKEGTHVYVIMGEHEGKQGKVTSTPWIGNLWHSTLQVNVPMDREKIKEVYAGREPGFLAQALADYEAGAGPRDWITVKSNEVSLTPREEI